MTKIKELEQLIIKHATEYYEGEPTISDIEFDALVEQLKKLDPKNKLLQTPGWGYEPEKRKYKHEIPMGSLEKIHDINEFKENNFIVSVKLDGLSCSVTYKNGELKRAVTRGNGKEGIVVTRNLLHYLPTKINDKREIHIRGEVLIYPEDSKFIITKKVTSDRNKASGLLMRKEWVDDIKYLKFIPFSLFIDKEEITPIKRFKWFKEVFKKPFVPFMKCDKKQFSKISLEKFAVINNHTVPCDGLVIESLDGSVKKAYKFEDQVMETTVKDITYQVSKNGRIIPIVHIEPLDLAGATITKCTGNNIQWLIDNKINIGAKVNVVRANMIIPKIVSVIEEKEYKPITNCPSCKSELKKESVHLVCKNPLCESKLIGILENIVLFYQNEGLGSKLVEKLYQFLIGNKTFTSIKEFLYFLDKKFKELISYREIPGFGVITSGLIVNIAKNYLTRKINPIEFMTILNIDHLGQKTIEKIVSNSENQFFILIKQQKWNELIHYGDNHKLVKEAFLNPLNQEKILTFYELKKELLITAVTTKSNKLKICITGSLNGMTKAQFYKKYNQLVSEEKSITKNTDYLICNESKNSSKEQKAKQLGIPIITQEQFKLMIKEGLHDKEKEKAN